MKTYKHLFGPVPSRRFGRSLGIDLMLPKLCSFDCTFCQLGPTTNKTASPQSPVPIQSVIDELADWIQTDGKADHITLAGSGEPTLHPQFADIIAFAHAKTAIPVVILTNGSMLTNPSIRNDASTADIVKVSLSAWNQSSFQQINRPCSSLQFDQIINGLQQFRAQFHGQLWMEVFLLKDVNSQPDQVRRIAALAKTIRPHKIQLNTVVRPPAEISARPLTKTQLQSLTHLFEPTAEIAADFTSSHKPEAPADHNTILAMLQRHPCTQQEIAQVLGMQPDQVSKCVANLEERGIIRAEDRNGGKYYTGASEEM